MTEKTLEQLADEYASTLTAVEEQIETCRRDIAQARLKHKNITLNNLCRKLSVLYDQRSELKETQAHLRSYYDEELRCAG